MDQNQRNKTEVNLCRFCLRPKRTMWSLKALYRKDSDFLSKIYQCSHIKIINMNELYTWVCRSCRQNIEKFAAFQNMLHENLPAFETRFRREQQQSHKLVDQQQYVVNVRYDQFSEEFELDDEEDLSDLEHHQTEQQSHSVASSDSGNQSEECELPEIRGSFKLLPTIREKD